MKPLAADEFYLEDGKFVLTERFHQRRGHCCGNGCRHCPFEHSAVPTKARRDAAAPWLYFGPEPLRARVSGSPPPPPPPRTH